MIKRELDLCSIKVAEPAFGNTAAVSEYYLESIAWLYPPEPGLDGRWSENLAILVDNPGARVVGEKRPGVVTEDRLLSKLKPFDPWILAVPATPPGTKEPGQRGQIRVEIGWKFKCHRASVEQPNLVKCRHE